MNREKIISHLSPFSPIVKRVFFSPTWCCNSVIAVERTAYPNGQVKTLICRDEHLVSMPIDELQGRMELTCSHTEPVSRMNFED